MFSPYIRIIPVSNLSTQEFLGIILSKIHHSSHLSEIWKIIRPENQSHSDFLFFGLSKKLYRNIALFKISKSLQYIDFQITPHKYGSPSSFVLYAGMIAALADFMIENFNSKINNITLYNFTPID
ncbi:MAG: hypothetical protein J1F12_08945 [Muribaculaceae bacterium]|nr:hypothetical protein [Muribaculaceae bacterium]